MEGIVYILKSADGKYYLGSTNNLKRRLSQHRSGHTWTTQRFDNFSLVFSQKFPSLAVARKVELRIKKLKRKDYIDKIVIDGYIKMNI